MTDRDLVPLRNGIEPHIWNKLTAVEKIQHLYTESLDVCLLNLTYRGDDKALIHARENCRHDVMMICAKLALGSERERSRNEALAALARGLSDIASRRDDPIATIGAEPSNRNARRRRNSAKSLK